MTFIKPQRQAAPWSDHNWWGQFDEAANLPNTATSDIQVASIELQRGDIAWAESEGSLYYCDDPTAGAAIWLPLGGGGSVVTLASDYYLSADNGNDANDGLTPATALATLSRVLELINEAERVEHGSPVTVHIGANAGGPYLWDRMLTLDLQDVLWFYADGAGQPGEDGFTELVAPTAAIAGTTRQSIILAAGPIVSDNDYIGATVEILTGAAAGDRRLIRNHTTTEIVPAKPFSDTVAIGDEWRIVQPETAIVMTEDVQQSGTVPNFYRQKSPTTDVWNGNFDQEVNDGYDGAVGLANLFIAYDSANFTVFNTTGTVRLYGCQRLSPSSGNLTLAAQKVYSGCDMYSGTFKLFGYGGALYSSFDDFAGPAVLPVFAGLSSLAGHWSGWGSRFARNKFNEMMGFFYLAPTIQASKAVLLGGSIGANATFSGDVLQLGRPATSDPTSTSVLPFLLNPLGDPADYGLWVLSGHASINAIEIGPTVQYGVVCGPANSSFAAGRVPTAHVVGNSWQIWSAETAAIRSFDRGHLELDSALLSGGTSGQVDFSGVNGRHVVVGQLADGPVFDVEVQNIEDLQAGDALIGSDLSAAYVLQSNADLFP